MISWLLGRIGRTNRRRAPGRTASTPARKLAPRAWSSVEALESREVLIGSGTVVPFATLSGLVDNPRKATPVVIRFDAGQLASDRSPSILLGLYARPAAGSTIVPKITTVESGSGRQLRVGMPMRVSESAAKQRFITSVPLLAGQAQNITVDVASQGRQTGNFDLDVFLPGDVNHDRVVDATDLALIEEAYGSAEGASNYNPDADFNGDGHVGCIDRQLATTNQGARVSYTPPPAPAAVQSVVSNAAVIVANPAAAPVRVTPAGVTPTVGQAVVQAPGATVWIPGTAA